MMKALDQTRSVYTRFLGGTIIEIDPASLRVTIQTAMTRKESFRVESADVLMRLSVGDHIRVEMDDQGRVKKIVKTS